MASSAEPVEIPPPIHQLGTLLPTTPKCTTIATFPPGTFLENLTVRNDGTLLVSDMLSGCIWYVDPRGGGEDTQSSIELVHKFEVEATVATTGEVSEANRSQDTEGSHNAYASTPSAQAIIRAPMLNSDVFYVTSGIHGKSGTWYLYELDMSSFIPQTRPDIPLGQDNYTRSATARGTARMRTLAPIPAAVWLNGGTAINHHPSGTVILADSYQGRLYSYHTGTMQVHTWLEHALLKKVTTRPPWPGVNGLQYHNGQLYFTNSDRAILGRIKVFRAGDHEAGVPVSRSLGPDGGEGGTEIQVLATGCSGDDLDIDNNGNIYVATNPMNTVLKFPGLARYESIAAYMEKVYTGDEQPHDYRYALEAEPERQVILGLQQASHMVLPTFDPDTTGPTAVAYQNLSEGKGNLYVVTNGGIINPLDGVVKEAKVLRIDLASWKVDDYGRTIAAYP